MIYLDTPVLVWLYAGKTELLSKKGVGLLEKEELFISPVIRLELQFLFEIGRTSVNSETICRDLGMRLDIRECNLAFSSVITRSLEESWTRDPFDRMIVAQAALQNGASLLTKDRRIQENYKNAVW